MNSTTLLANNILSLLTLVAFVASVVVLVCLFASFINSAFKQRFLKNGVVAFFGKNALVAMFLITVFGFLGSNFYSMYAGFVPCVLCIWQRFFFFPQFFILGLALWRKNDTNILPYSILLSMVGGVIALYHYYGQILNPSSLPCEADKVASACAYIPFLSYGFITIPFMSLVAFMSLLALGLLGVMYRRR